MANLEIYKAKDGWRWRLIRKGRIIAEGGQAYKRCPKRATLLKQLADALIAAGLLP